MKKKTFAGIAAIGALLGAATAAGVVIHRQHIKRQLAAMNNKSLPPKRNIYFAGGGLAALSGAYYLIHDCNIPGDCIHIFEGSANIGGAFNVGGDAESGFIMTVPKLFSERNHANLMDMLSGIKSLSLPELSVKEEIINYMNANPVCENARLISADGQPTAHGFGLTKKTLNTIKSLLSAKDYAISAITVEDYFAQASELFNSNFWAIISSSYLLRRRSSAEEFKHILSCISGEISELYTMKNVVRTQFNEQETVIAALEAYLKAHDVNFATHCSVVDAEFEEGTNRVVSIHLDDNGTQKTFYLNKNDLLFVTNGSSSECATIGDYNYPAPVSDEIATSAALWKKLAAKRDDMGAPEKFCDDSDSEMISFTITAKSRLLLDRINELTGNDAVSGVLTTFKGSPWGLTISNIPQPYFAGQDDDITVICGYGTDPDAEGKYIDKAMRYASGAEILFELVKHLGLDDRWDEITENIINVIPCAMPYATAPSLPYSTGEKPLITSGDSGNMAFIGQFVKLGAGISYSSEYTVRTAREAAYRLTGSKKSSTPPPRPIMSSYVKMFKALKK